MTDKPKTRQFPTELTPVVTEDGSLSYFNPEARETYHNKAGAFTEALVNFVRPSGVLSRVNAEKELRVLDPCYGLGYNTWVLVDEILKLPVWPKAIYLTAIESDPNILEKVEEALKAPLFTPLKQKIRALGHNIHYRTQALFSSFSDVLEGPEGQKTELHFELFVEDLRMRVPQLEGPYEVVMHDAFSAQKMPELWTVDLFREYYRLVFPTQGTVITYSSAAGVRGGLLEAGFKLAKTHPLGEKNGGTVAYLSVPPEDAMELNEDEKFYLETRAGIPYRDPGLSRMAIKSRETITEARKREQHGSGRPSGAGTRSKLLQQ